MSRYAEDKELREAWRRQLLENAEPAVSRERMAQAPFRQPPEPPPYIEMKAYALNNGRGGLSDTGMDNLSRWLDDDLLKLYSTEEPPDPAAVGTPFMRHSQRRALLKERQKFEALERRIDSARESIEWRHMMQARQRGY